MNASVLELRDVRTCFGAVAAVDGVSLDVADGRITGLIGPNGAGKSTLFHTIAGVTRPTSGEVRFAGARCTGEQPDQLFRRGLAQTFQLPRPFARLSVLDNLLLAPLAQTGETLRGALLRPARVCAEESRMRTRALELLDFMTLADHASSPAGTLSGGQTKLLELARVMMVEPRLVLLDEPAAGVAPSLVDVLADRLRALNSNGTAFFVVEHDLGLVARLCDSVVAMHRGRIVYEGSLDGAREDPTLQTAYLGGSLQPARLHPSSGNGTSGAAPAFEREVIAPTPPLLEVDALEVGYRPEAPIVRGASLTATAGEVVALLGPNGAGKSTLIKAVAGLLRATAGRLRLAGRCIAGVPAHRLGALGVAYVPQTANVFAELSVAENLSVSARRLARSARAAATARALERFTVLAEKRRQPAGQLSGGQRQLLALAMAWLVEPKLLLSDEPTAGLAPAAAEAIFAELRAIADAGAAVLLVEQNARGALAIADRGVVLSEGRNRRDGAADELLADPELARLFMGSRK